MSETVCMHVHVCVCVCVCFLSVCVCVCVCVFLGEMIMRCVFIPQGDEQENNRRTSQENLREGLQVGTRLWRVFHR